MVIVPPHLRVVAAPGPARTASRPAAGDGSLEDVAVVATLFAIALLPIAGALAHLGTWTQGELGLSAAGTLFSGRELWASAFAARRARRRT
ncbi:hypothetical protein PSR1_02692 [Anaeromyxobacter sp. PSR-1]|nr:hypothetical protein PSR1_02692 [Anaeromyxobacter sp. PSR-1]